ncbi:universal stress protein [Thalassococcus sp. BH17M4-6]|uniref:universal stress protein n=1 Tax=Thalassococcus sp. BH17M4-6 TaxID=3413148 RepID=UPI003BBD2D82
MYSNILVPILFDDDDRIRHAMDVAKLLAGEDGAITLLHVMEDIPTYAVRYLSDDSLKLAQEAISNQLDALAASLQHAKGVLIHGHSGRSVLEYASANSNDLIIIASHRPGMQDLFLGSTATQVVRHAQCAVHVLR